MVLELSQWSRSYLDGLAAITIVWELPKFSIGNTMVCKSTTWHHSFKEHESHAHFSIEVIKNG